MGIFSKAWKGIKKAVKKIGKGIKKVFKKVGAAIGKLGIVGQIGMMFLMPYATSALGSFFGASGKLATWSSKLLKAGGIGSKALGHGLNLINKAGTFAGNVYNSVSQTIGNAVDRVTNFAKGKGFTLSEGRTSIFAKKTPESLTKVLDAQKPFDITKATPEEFTAKLTKDLDLSKVPGTTDISSFKAPDLTGFVPEKQMKLTDFFEIDAKEAFTMPDLKIGDSLKGIEGLADVTEFTKPNINVSSILEKPKDISLTDKIKSIPGEIKKGVQEFDVKEAVTKGLESSVTGGLKQAGTQQVAKAFGYEQPEGADYYNIDIPEMMDAGYSSPSIFKEVDFSMQKSGNNFMVQNYQNSNYLNNLIGEGNSAYDSYMANFAASQYQPFNIGA